MLGKGHKGKCTPDGRPCALCRPLHTVSPCPGQVFSPLGCGVYRLAVILFFGGVSWLVLRFILRFLPHLQRGLRLVLLSLLLRLLLFRRLMCPCRVVRVVPFLAGSLSFVFVRLRLLVPLLVCGRGGWVSLVSCVAWPFLCLAFPWGRCLLFSSFSSVGFSGSRSLSGGAFAQCRSLAAAAASSGVAVLVGCASGADAAARLGAGSAAQVFRAASFARPGVPFSAALVARSVAFVQALAASPAPCLVSFPAAACPFGLAPAARWPSGFGSGSWASLALAVGLRVPVFVFLPAAVLPPLSWGIWSRVTSGVLAGSWSLVPVVPPQLSLF